MERKKFAPNRSERRPGTVKSVGCWRTPRTLREPAGKLTTFVSTHSPPHSPRRICGIVLNAFFLKSASRAGDVLIVITVVVIDDNELIAEVLAGFLKSAGFNVRVATSARAGLGLVTEIVPDAVVCDMRMPELCGADVIEQIKSQPRTSHIPVVLVTSYCTPEVLGIADALLLKPVRNIDLVAAVQQLTSAVATPRPTSQAKTPSKISTTRSTRSR
jgi:CheY-like chemotaxis protein